MTESNRTGRLVSERLTWGILVGGALLLRALFATSRLVLSGDETHYAESLHHFMRGRIFEGLSDYWSFLYPLAAVPFGLICRDAEAGLRLLSMLSGAALLIPSMAIAKEMWGGRAALFTGLFIALHTNLLICSAAAMTESFFSLLVMLALLCFLRAARDGGGRSVILTGLLLGLACLVRQEAQILVLIPVIFLLAGAGGNGISRPARKRLASALLLVLFFILPLLPHAVLLHEKTGRWFVQSKAAVNLSSPLIWDDGLEREKFVYTLNEEGTDRRINEIGRTNPLGLLWDGRREIGGRYVRQLTDAAEQLPLLLVSPFLLLLVPLGLFARRWRMKRRELLIVAVGLFP
ncbi:MAG TPA: phospholipid carrier-dependent glycosyltransferase, partial [Candidatus Eisenbacteria bacterium]|nr:phospholipid carrier-dependent glycosyltransferase [Candidatus Eisenbacteria bacterium]